MQKKVLASILVTPLALSAFANITVNENLAGSATGWNQTGISGQDSPFKEDGIFCPIGSGSLTKSLGTLNPGKYVVRLVGAENVRAIVSDGTNNYVSNGEDITFEVIATTEYNLIITGAKADEAFLVKSIAFEIVFNLDEIKTNLNNALNDVVLTAVAEGDESEAAKALIKEAEDLAKQKEALTTLVGGLTETKENYDSYELWKDDNKIKLDIDKLAASVKEHNEKVVAENAHYQLGVDNEAAYKAWIDSAKGLKALLEAQTARYSEENMPDKQERTYVFNTNNAVATSINGEIDAWMVAIDNAYKDKYKEDITVADEKESITNKINDLKAQIDASEADWKAYQALMDKQAELTAATSTALATFDSEDYKGVAGMNKSFDEFVAKQQTDVRTLYSEALAAVATKRLEDPTVAGSLNGVSDNKDKDMPILDKAIEDVNAIPAAAQAALDTYTANVETVNGLVEEFEKIPALPEGLPETEVAKYNDLKKAAEDAVNALKTQVNDDYAAVLDTAAAEDAIKAVNDFLTAWAPVIDLIKDLEILKNETIPGLQEASKIPVSEFDLAGKFAGTIASLDEAIKAIYTGKEPSQFDTNKIKDVKAAIAERGDFATKLIKIYVEASASVADFEELVKGLDKDIADKLIVADNSKPAAFKDSETYTDLAAKLKEVQDDIIAVRSTAVSPQVSYETAIALQKKVEGYPEAVAAAVHEFEKTYTANNNKTVETALTDLSTYAADGEYLGKTTDFSELQTELDGIAAKITAADALADNAEDLVKTYAGIDTELQALYDKIAAKKAEIKALKDNKAAYDELIALVPGKDAIKALAEYNANSNPPADKWYADNVIGASDPAPGTGLYKDRSELLGELRKAYEEKKAFTDKEALSGKISAFKGKIDQTYKDIDANNAAYTAQTIESARVRDYVDKLIEAINKKAEEAGVFAGENPLNDAVTTWVETLTALRDNDLNDNDLAANGNYGKGQASVKNQEVMDEYKRIEEAAKAIDTEFTTQFGDKVKATNALTVENANWEAAYAYTDGVYRQSIQTYNSFFQLTNVHYSTYILKVVQTHRDIYQYSKKITELKAAVAAYVNDFNEQGKVFTADEFYAVSLKIANDYIAEMETKVALMMKQSNDAAKAYFNGEKFYYANDEGGYDYVDVNEIKGAVTYYGANETIENAKVVLESAGVAPANFSKAIGNAQGYLSAAYEAFTNNENAFLLAVDFMDGIADNLDKVVESINLDAAAVAQWNDNYEAASATLTALSEQLDKCTSDGDASRTLIAYYINAASELNLSATDIINLASKTGKLKTILDNAQKVVDQMQTEFDNDQANKALAAEFQTRLDKLMADYYALAEYVGTITAEVSLNNIEAAIESVRTEIDKDKASLVANKTNIENLFEVAENDIFSMYGVAQFNEIQALYSLLAKTKVAFNNAKVYSTSLSEEEIAAYNDKIDNLEKGKANAEGEFEGGIYELNGLYTVYTRSKVSAAEKIAARAQFHTLAQSIEEDLANVYVELEASYTAEFEGENIGGNPVPDIVAALEEQYTAIESKIVDASEAFTRYFASVHEKYPDGYNAISEALEAVKNLWEADGNKVVLNAETYQRDMTAIAAEFEALKVKIVEDQTIAETQYQAMLANDAAYKRLEVEISTWEEQLNTLAELIGSYDLVASYKSNINRIAGNIEDARFWLDSEHARVYLTAESEFNYPYNNIPYDILRTTVNVERRHVSDVQTLTWKVINGTLSIFTDNTVVPEIAAEQLDKLNGLKADMSNIASDYDSRYYEYRYGYITSEEFIEECHKFDERYQAVIATAEEIQTIANDNIFHRGDVTLDPDGTVNATDLQMIIGWILDGTTYQQLFEENARQAAAADLTGDKDLNIADATAEVELILNEDNGVDIRKVAPRLVSGGLRTGDNTFALTMLNSANGERDYALTLNNADTFIAGQFDVQLPVGMSIKDVVLDARAANHQVMFKDNGNGNYRIVVISMSNDAIEGHEGVLLHIITDGIGTPTLSNGIFADDQNAPVQVSEIHTSMVDSIYNGAVNMKERIYDAAGRSLRAVQRGINIIRKSDGTTTKEFRK